MESGNGASSSTGYCLPVPLSSDDFSNCILAQLQSAYLFEESKHSFKYTAAFFVKNPTLEEKYNAFREKRREQGYKDDHLKETYGFLLFDDLSKAKSIGESGVHTANGTCTTLGDPTKGVYLSMYSDCLDLNRWYHGKSGYIAILRLTQGKVKKICENYTQNLTEPTVGFDSHVSEQLPSVSSKTSSFLAFERTQYYLYELLDNGTAAQSPSLACPYAIVAFSYTDTKETQQEKSKEKRIACPYSPWMGTLQIGSQTFNVQIRSTAGALTRAKLPPVIRAEKAISMLNIRKLVPKAIFDTTLNGKVVAPHEDRECSLCEIVALSSEEKEKLTPLLLVLKEKDVALTITLSDGGFLVLIHGSHCIFHDNENGIATNKVLQGVFVFPESQAIQRVAKNDPMKRRLPSEALRVLPLLTYAEGEIEKTSLSTTEDLCETFVHYMQSYATLISPGPSSSPVREVSIFPDQYDVPNSHGHLYSTPEWTDKQWQNLKLYLKNASSFQLPVCKASEIFITGQEVRREDLEDDIYICLSSPEEQSTDLTSIGSDNRLDQECSVNVEISQDTGQPVSVASQIGPNVETEKEISRTLNSLPSTEMDNNCKETLDLCLRTDESSEELIVSVTAASHAVEKNNCDVIKHDQLSVAAEFQKSTLNSLNEIVQSKLGSNCADDSDHVMGPDKLPLGHNFESTQSPSLQIVKTLLGKEESFMDIVTTQQDKHFEMSEAHGNEKENDTTSSKKTQVLEQAIDMCLTDNALLKELENCTLRKKSERLGLKPVVTTCGRIFIPFGSIDSEQIKALKKKLQFSKDKGHPDERMVDALSEVSNKQETGSDKDTTKTVDECPIKSIGHKHLDIYPLTNNSDHVLQEHKENLTKDIAENSKGGEMLKKLKSVILKKRSTDFLRTGLNSNDNLNNEPSPKRTRRALTPEKINSDVCNKESNVDHQNKASLPSVDPIFAHALGLTPKETLNLNCVQRIDPSMEKEILLAKEYPSCSQQTQSSPKGFGPRLKMLKKNQSISAEQVRKKWWLHFQTPTCYAEKQYEGSSRDISIRKTVKEKTDTSSEALNLLADLALSANKEQVSPHPIQACFQEFGSSLKKCEITKDCSQEQQSVLHALLRQPAPKPIQPHETPSPDFGGSELVDVICQEHAYSLPSSPSLLLALPAPFQVSPLNGSSRLLHTQRQWEGAQTIHPFFSPEEKEGKRKDPGDPRRSWYRRKFCLFRTIVNNEKSVQVTRRWEGLYDFNLDSRFTVDPKDKTVVRALHGPWDLSIHDTTEEVQLIVHMWIGLFYSRSTARFFHLDSDKPLACSEDTVLDTVDVSIEKGHEQSISETILSTPFSNEEGPEQSVPETNSLQSAEDRIEPKVLDLSKPKNCDGGKKPDVLNLSQRQSNMEVTNQSPEMKEKTQASELSTLNTKGQQPAANFQWYWNLIHTSGNATPLKYVGVTVNENNVISSGLNHQIFIPIWNGNPNANIWTSNISTSALPSAELNDHQAENVPIQFPKHPESPVRKRVSRKRTQKDVFPSSVPHKDVSQDNKKRHQENSTELNPGKEVEHRTSKHNLRKLTSTNDRLTFQTSRNDKDRNYNLLKKLLQDTPKCQQPSDGETNPNPSQHSCSSQEKMLNQSIVQRQHIFAFPKAFTTSIVTETCTENRNEQNAFNIDLAPLVDLESIKRTSIDAIDVSCNEKKAELETLDCLPGLANQDAEIKGQDTSVENTMDCSLSQDESVKSVEASFIIQTDENNRSLNEAENNYTSVTIPFIGLNTSIEDMLKDNTSNEMDVEKALDNKEIDASDSSASHCEVLTPLCTYAKSKSQDETNNHNEKSVIKKEICSLFDTQDGESNERCPTPTIDEQLYAFTSQSNVNVGTNDLENISQDFGEKIEERSCTPVLDENSVDAEVEAEVGAQSDVELRTLRTLQCLDEFLSSLQNKSKPLLLNSKNIPKTSIVSNKKASPLIYDFKGMKTPSSVSHFCPPESVDCLYPSRYKNQTLEQPKENWSASFCNASTEKPEPAKICKNDSGFTSQCPDVTESPPKMNKGQMSSVKQTTDCEAQFKPIRFSIKRTKQGRFICSGPVFDYDHHNESRANHLAPSSLGQFVEQDLQNLQCTETTSSKFPTHSMKSMKSTSKQVKEEDSFQRQKTDKGYCDDILNCTTSYVDGKTNKIKDDSLGTEGSLSCTVNNTKRMGPSFLEKISQRCLQDDPTQSSMDQECLIFLDKMKLLLKRTNGDKSNLSSSSPIIVQFSHLQEENYEFDCIQPFSFVDQKICVDMSDREQLRDVKPQSSKPLTHSEMAQPGISAIKAECARLYKDIMDKICAGNRNSSLLKDLHKTDSGDSMTDSCNHFDFCSQMKREMDGSFRDRLNSVVKKSCKSKNRFFLLVTSDDVFFNETREYLEAGGHIPVQPSDFFLRESSSSPFLVIIRNEDIAEHIFKVPHLLQLRLSPVVQFAGIDEPDDVVNLTYQEVFIKGGFVMFDRAAVESLSPGNISKILEILKRLIQAGKWKWMLHYRDSRRLKENARLCPNAKEKTDLLDKCKEDGLLDILPYHECDLMSREQPNYLQCLCHQQVQNISARYPVFVSDSKTDRDFENNGIVTMTVNSFLMDSLSKTINSFT